MFKQTVLATAIASTLILAGCGQKEVSYEDLSENSTGQIIFQGELFSGIAVEYDGQGAKLRSQEIDDGIFHGEYIEYHRGAAPGKEQPRLTGQKKEINGGLRDYGKFSDYSTSGKVIGKSEYNDSGSPVGKHYLSDEKGNLLYERHYSSEGQYDGGYNTWLESDPKIQTLKSNYVNGERDGEYKEWRHTGELKLSTIYSKGKIEGVYEEYCEDGSLGLKVTYEEGALNGAVNAWNCLNGDSKPSVKAVEAFAKDGLYEGSYTEFDNGGNVRIKGEFANHAPIGEWVQYSDGQISAIHLYGTADQFLPEKVQGSITSALGIATRRYQWASGDNWGRYSTDGEKIEFYASTGDLDPKKAIVIEQQHMSNSVVPDYRHVGSNNSYDKEAFEPRVIAITAWTYPIIAAPEEVFDKLIAMGADVTVHDSQNNNRLHYCLKNFANKRCSVAHAKALSKTLSLSEPSTIDLVSEVTNITAVQFTWRGEKRVDSEKMALQKTMLEIMNKAGFQWNKSGKSGKTLLTATLSERDQIHLLDYAISKSDVNQPDSSGLTPVQKLLERGTADISKNGIEPVLEKLVAAGADLAIPIKDGRTLKDVAYESGNIGLYNYITKHTH